MGRKCIRFCERINFEIANGIVKGDEEGKTTYVACNGRGESTVDFCILKEESIGRMQKFTVHNLSQIRVTDHCLILCVLNSELHLDISNKKKRIAKFRWEQSKWKSYGNKVAENLQLLDDIRNNFLINNQSNIASRFSTKFCNILGELSKQVFQDRGTNSNNPQQGWWDEECNEQRNKVTGLYENSIISRQPSSGLLREETKKYKSLIKRKKQVWADYLDDELAKKAKREPAKFWALMKEIASPFSHLPSIEVITEHFQKLLGDIPTEPGSNCSQVVEDAGESNCILLSGDFTEAEIASALWSLKNNTVSADGYASELYKYAVILEENTGCRKFLLAPYIATLFNRIFKEGVEIPKDWNRSVIVPIYKGKGSKSDLDNYRGISLSNSLYKLYATVINVRLDKYCELKGLRVRAYTQCGFRKKLGTVSALFLMRHLIYATCPKVSKGGKDNPLLACFIDFRKAFDMVPRERIWKRMKALGIGVSILQAVHRLYEHPFSVVKLNGVVSQTRIVTNIGVKQGLSRIVTLITFLNLYYSLSLV